MDPQEHLIRSLEARMRSIRRGDEEAAALDLARSLAAGALLIQTLPRAGHALLLDGGTALEVTEVGPDHCAAGRPVRVFAPLIGAAFVRRDDLPRPKQVEASLTERLRRLAAGTEVEVRLWDGRSLGGGLAKVGPDHLVLEGVAGETLVSAGALAWISLSRAD